MFSFGVFFLIIVSRTSGNTDFESSMNSRIVGGTPASIKDYPYQVAIEEYGGYMCGGSIINTKVILTAAHCLDGVKSYSLQVRAGSSSAENGGFTVRVSSFKMHPEFVLRTFANDVALLYLARPLVYNDFIKNVELSKTAPSDGRIANVNGWGASSFYSNNSKILKKTDVIIIGNKKCASSEYGYGSKILDGMICAYSDGKDACSGDSGGPLVVDGVQVGVISWGTNCAKVGYPGVYADVAYYFQWISNNLNPNLNGTFHGSKIKTFLGYLIELFKRGKNSGSSTTQGYERKTTKISESKWNKIMNIIYNTVDLLRDVFDL